MNGVSWCIERDRGVVPWVDLLGYRSVWSLTVKGEGARDGRLTDILVVLLPRKSFELKQRHTSGIMKCPAMSSESSRFSSASFLRSEKGTWDPAAVSLVCQGTPTRTATIDYTSENDWLSQILQHEA